MRIGILTFSLHGGGAERMVARLANAFVGKGIDVDILLLYEIEGRVYDLEREVNVVDVCNKSRNLLKKRVVQIRKLRCYLENKKPDVILSFIYTTLPFPVIAGLGLKHKFKIIGTQRTNPKVLKKMYNVMVMPFLRKADGFIFQTKGSQKCYPLWLQKKSIVIPNVAPKVQTLPQEKRIEKSICTVGRLVESKDYDTIFKALKLITNRFPDVCLHVYGDGDKKEEYIKSLKKMGIRDKVVFEGFSRNVVEDIKKYEVFLFASKAEGMPNSLVEAMAAGLVCVATNCEYGPADLIQDGVNGYLVSVSDYKKMAEKTIYLLENSKIRNEISKKAAQISEYYSEEIITDRFLTYIERVCEV